MKHIQQLIWLAATRLPEEEVAGKPEESQPAHWAIGDDKFSNHTMDDKCTCKCTGEMMRSQ